MVAQIEQTSHQEYLWQLYDYVEPPTPGRVDPVYGEDMQKIVEKIMSTPKELASRAKHLVE